ncbi:MAG: UvrD-helicase domain-containing protein [Bacteroidales bacterium]
MELTREQINIINSTGNIKINAVAGSGKTTTIIEYAKARPANSKILYLAFNKSVKLEAVKKFAESGLANVKVETAHSLAFKHVVYNNDYKVRSQGYKTHEIVELLGLHGNGEKHTEYIVANHISKFISYFCNSEKLKVQDLNYLDVVSDSKAKEFVAKFYDYIESQTRLLLSKMDKGEIEVTHDFYLKKFQLSNPVLNFDYILFDEGQDASPAMLDVFLKQKAVKVIVGDTHQQIYGWRFAVNSLEKTDFKTYDLSTSFRFSQDIANLAREVLQWKNYLQDFKPVHITGNGNTREYKVKAVLARTNLGLLLKAIEYVTEKKKIKHIYFEGKKEEINLSKINEEINLLYVAITRTKNSIHIPQALLPKDLPRCSQIHIIKDESVEEKKNKETIKFEKIPNQKPKQQETDAYKAYLLEEIRKKQKNAYKPWSPALDDELTIMYCEGVNVKDMAKHFGRTKGAIRARIEKLELEELYG